MAYSEVGLGLFRVVWVSFGDRLRIVWEFFLWRGGPSGAVQGPFGGWGEECLRNRPGGVVRRSCVIWRCFFGFHPFDLIGGSHHSKLKL